MAEATTKTKRSKGLFQSMTVFCALLMLMAYFGAGYANLSEDIRQGVLVVGTAAISIFMRRAVGGPKPMWRSMTVVCSLLMVGLYFWAAHSGAAPQVKDAIFLLGTVLIVIYMRRALIGVYGDRN